MGSLKTSQIDSQVTLRVGLLCPNPFFEMLLNQIGVDWFICDSVSGQEITSSCVVLNRPLSRQESDYWKTRATEHTCLILDVYANLYEFNLHNGYYSPPISSNDPLLGTLSDLPFLAQPVFKTKNAQFLDHSVYFDPYSSYAWCGWRFRLPTSETKQSVKSFPSVYGNMHRGSGLRRFTKSPDPSESIHDLPYAHYRHLVQNLLLILHDKFSVPFVRKSAYPENDESVFLFRVDSDYSQKQHYEPLFRLLDTHQIRSTWFLHTEAHESNIEDFRAYSEHEFAVHGHRHRYLKERSSLRNNIRQSYSIVSQIRTDRTIDGYAEPFGNYHPALSDLLSEHSRLAFGIHSDQHKNMQFLYSSEFGFDANNLPHWPLLTQGPLQIPIHPVCPGSFTRTTASRDEMKIYFEHQMYLALKREDPLAFYHHPMQAYDDVLEHMFIILETLKERGLRFRNMTFSEWARWWTKREETTFNVLYSPLSGGILIQEFGSSSGMSAFNINYRMNHNGIEYILPPGQYSKKISDSLIRVRYHDISEPILTRMTENQSHQQKFHHLRNELLNQLGRLTQ